MRKSSSQLLKKAFLLGSLACWTSLCANTRAEEFRALWVDAFGNGILTPSQVSQLVNDCRTYNFNAVVVQIRRRGDAFYMPQAPNGDPRTTALAANYDALQELIDQCHNSTPRIEVHAWISAYLVWSATTPPSQPGHIFNLHPEYLTKNSAGTTFLEDGYWVDPGHPEAMTWTYNVAKDIVSRYNIDGFHWDRIRYPEENSGFNEVAISRYNAEFGLTGQPLPTASQFKNWRRRQVTDFIRWTSADLLEIKPSLIISASVFANRTDATSFRYQDWAAWANEGLIDILMPMAYVNATANPGVFETRVNDIFNNQGVRRAYIGVGAYLNTKENTLAQLNYVRSKPFLGSAFYSYRTSNSGTIDQAGTFEYVRDNYQPTYEPTPVLPWIANPTKAIIKGTVIRQSDGAPIYNAALALSGSGSSNQKTEPHGKYAFFEVNPGTYSVTASSAGISSASSITVQAGGIYNVDFVLDLPPADDTVPPIITHVAASSVTSTSAVVTWRTDEMSDSAVEYGLTTTYGSNAGNGGVVTNHTVTLNDLTPNTTYHFRVKSRDAAGNLGVSANFQLTTTPAVPDIIIDNPQAQVIGAWSTATSAADKFGVNYNFRTFGVGANSLLYTPNIQVAGYYRVFEWHPAGGNRATNTPVIVSHAGGVTTNRVNQQVGGGQWIFVGTFFFNQGTSGTIRISDAATGPASAQVMADAIRLSYLPETFSDPIIVDNPAAVVVGSWTTATSAADKFGVNYLHRTFGVGNNFAEFMPSLPVPGTYQVYEWHSQGSNRATNTPHIVTHAGGTTTNRVNQQINGGKWNLIGTYVFNAGPGAKVRISDAATGPTSAQVMVDAIKWEFLPPPVPGNLTATTVSSTEIHLRWVDNSSDEASFTIARSTTPNGPYTVIGSAPANSTSFADTGLEPGTTYYYAIRATTGPGGASAYSNEATATTLPNAPAAPGGLTATTISSSQIDLAWSDNNDAADVSYIVARSTSAGGPFEDIATVGSRVQAYEDTGLAPLTTYFYQVRATNAGGESDACDTASATTLSDAPAAPGNLAAVAVSPTRVDLSWSDNANNEDSYSVVRSTLGGGYSTIATLPANSTSYSDTTVSGHTTYYYYVQAANATGSSASDAVSVTTPNSAPVAAISQADQTLSADHNCSASIVLDGSGSSDPDQDTLSHRWTGSFGTVHGAAISANLPPGVHVITLTVEDEFGGSDSAQVTVTVVDTTAPTLSLNGSSVMTVEAASAFSDPGAVASDNCGGNLTGSISVSGTVNMSVPGTYTLTYSVSDPSGNPASASRTVIVRDTTAPVISSLSSSVTYLWPVNHQMVRVEFSATVTDAVDAAPAVQIVSITSSQSSNGTGDGNTVPDWEILGPMTANLRAEREGSKTDRIYTITVEAVDASGNRSTRTINVIAPHDQRN